MRTIVLTLLLLATATAAQAQRYFQNSGGVVTFSKAPFADPTDPTNQDAITDSVAITRGNTQGIYNAVSELGSQGSSGDSPLGTSWYFGGTVQDVIDGLLVPGDFLPWAQAHGRNPPSTVGDPAVLYLINDDAYVDLTFTAWGFGTTGGGSFAYDRAVVNLIPEPASSTLLGVITFGLSTRRRRR